MIDEPIIEENLDFVEDTDAETLEQTPEPQEQAPIQEFVAPEPQKQEVGDLVSEIVGTPEVFMQRMERLVEERAMNIIRSQFGGLVPIAQEQALINSLGDASLAQAVKDTFKGVDPGQLNQLLAVPQFRQMVTDAAKFRTQNNKRSSPQAGGTYAPQASGDDVWVRQIMQNTGKSLAEAKAFLQSAKINGGLE